MTIAVQLSMPTRTTAVPEHSATPGAAPRQRLLSINNYYYRRGGAESVFFEHNRLFEERNWDVAPFCMHHRNNLPTPWSEFFVDEIEFGRAYGLTDKIRRAGKVIYSREAQRNLGKLIARAKPDLAHAHNVYHHLSPAIFSVLREAGIPTVLTLHDLKLACPAYTMLRNDQPCESCRGGKIYNVARHRCVKGSAALSAVVLAETLLHGVLGSYRNNVDRFVVPSRFYIDKFVEWGWPRERFVHIPNFIDTKQLRTPGEPGRHFLYAGRLSPEKGLVTLIRAAAAAQQPLKIAGSGPQEPVLRQLASELNADVTFLGYLNGPALHTAICSARALVLPSEWYENAPVSVLEAYGLGRPVIGARIGGIPELVRDGETGTTFPPGDAQALADCLADMAARPTSAIGAMGRAGRRLVETEYSAAQYVSRVSALYDELLEAR